ncbi:hypothetical protein QUF31_21765 [Dickeya chrysanthemi]|nr:hypothetical protein [Dickeya chrysanthemi]WJM87699.1 hypothetical protein QUF31_21765 [Dickeya chrysanthemi]
MVLAGCGEKGDFEKAINAKRTHDKERLVSCSCRD